MATEAPVVPEEMLFQGSVQVLVAAADGSQEWSTRYMCLFCNPACFCLYRSEMSAKKPSKHYVFLPPTGSSWAPDDDFHGVAGVSFRVEAQGGIWVRASCCCCIRGGCLCGAHVVWLCGCVCGWLVGRLDGWVRASAALQGGVPGPP